MEKDAKERGQDEDTKRMRNMYQRLIELNCGVADWMLTIFLYPLVRVVPQTEKGTGERDATTGHVGRPWPEKTPTRSGKSRPISCIDCACIGENMGWSSRCQVGGAEEEEEEEEMGKADKA